MCMIRSDNKPAIPITDRQSRVGNVTYTVNLKVSPMLQIGAEVLIPYITNAEIGKGG